MPRYSRYEGQNDDAEALELFLWLNMRESHFKATFPAQYKRLVELAESVQSIEEGVLVLRQMTNSAEDIPG